MMFAYLGRVLSGTLPHLICRVILTIVSPATNYSLDELRIVK